MYKILRLCSSDLRWQQILKLYTQDVIHLRCNYHLNSKISLQAVFWSQIKHLIRLTPKHTFTAVPSIQLLHWQWSELVLSQLFKQCTSKQALEEPSGEWYGLINYASSSHLLSGTVNASLRVSTTYPFNLLHWKEQNTLLLRLVSINSESCMRRECSHVIWSPHFSLRWGHEI